MKKIAILLLSCLFWEIAFVVAGYATCSSCHGSGVYNQKYKCVVCDGIGSRACAF